MTSIDDLYSEIPTQQIAQRLGADENEVRSAVKTIDYSDSPEQYRSDR